MQENTSNEQHTWDIYGWEDDGWVELGSTFNEEEDARRILTKWEDEAQEAENPPFRYFALMRSDAEIFPPDPTVPY